MKLRSAALLLSAGLLPVLVAPSLKAQPAVAARAGMIHHTQGTILLDQEPLEAERYRFPLMDDGAVLETRRGLAEVLLNAGTFLRMAEYSSIQLDSGDLTDTRLTILEGTVLIEVDDLRDDNLIVIAFGGHEVKLHKKGLYHFTAEPARLRVYDGEARVAGDIALEEDDALKVKKGREFLFASAVDPTEVDDPDKFDRDETDPLYRWSTRRARAISRANASSARLMLRSTPAPSPGWLFNRFYGGYTYVPQSGYGYSPFGVTLYSPQAIDYALRPRRAIDPFANSFGSGFGGISLGRITISGSAGGGAAIATPSRSSGVSGASGAGRRR